MENKQDATVVRVMLSDLHDWYPRLSVELVPSSGASDGVKATNPPGPKLPLRVDVMDLILELQQDALRWEKVARVALGFNVAPDRNVGRAIDWLGEALETLDADMVRHFENDISRYHHQISILIGKKDKPPQIDEIKCPYCNKRLVIMLGQGLIMCRNRLCRCSGIDCNCQYGKGHSWPQTEWLLLGRMISVLDSVKSDTSKAPEL